MADPQTQAPTAAAGSTLKRYVLIGLPILILVVIALVVFWPSLELGFKINALNSDNAETRRNMRVELIQAPREAWVDDQLCEAVEDSERSFELRHIVVDVLAERNRLGSHLEPAYLLGDLDTRSVILAWLQGQAFFQTTYVEDPRFEVRETVRAWLAREGDFTRTHAILIAQQLGMSDAVALIRPILDTQPEAVPTSAKRRQNLIIAAMGALDAFDDCESVPRILEVARAAGNPVVRWRAAQVLDRMVTGERADCPGAISEAEMAALMVGFLEDADPVPRIGALTNFEKHPERARAVADRILEILDGDAASDPEQGPERRHALLVMIGLADPAFLDRLPAYFFDENINIRSSLAQAAFNIKTPRLESCLIGLVDREADSQLVYRFALDSLRQLSGRWHGVTDELQRSVQTGNGNLHEQLALVFDGEEIEGTTRPGMVEAWFAWLASDLGLDANAQKQAWASRQAFWVAADKGDTAAAQQALDDFGLRVPGLFTYEEAWLASR